MKKFWRMLLFVCCLLLATALLFYAFMVHPNDQRLNLSWMQEKLEPKTSFYEEKAAFFLGAMPHAIDMSDADYSKAKALMWKALPDFAMGSSTRFISKYQVYVPVGLYP